MQFYSSARAAEYAAPLADAWVGKSAPRVWGWTLGHLKVALRNASQPHACGVDSGTGQDRAQHTESAPRVWGGHLLACDVRC
jgi:hypothetical protein